MKREHLMGMRDHIARRSVAASPVTHMSPGFRLRLTQRAIADAFEFYSTFLKRQPRERDVSRLAREYMTELEDGGSLGLFVKGGVGEKHHLNLWCLGRVLEPTRYVESGVYVGSSLHAFLKSPGLKEIVAIDPDLSNLRLRVEDDPRIRLVDSEDFSELRIEGGANSLVYFDDHIDTARRIVQAAERGFRYALFDDSTGVEGICQRLYPAVPTVPLIMTHDTLQEGDTLSWVYTGPRRRGIRAAVGRLVARKGGRSTEATMVITAEMLADCRAARSCVANWTPIPDLGVYIPQRIPGPMIDTTKYLLELRRPA